MVVVDAVKAIDRKTAVTFDKFHTDLLVGEEDAITLLFQVYFMGMRFKKSGCDRGQRIGLIQFDVDGNGTADEVIVLENVSTLLAANLDVLVQTSAAQTLPSSSAGAPGLGVGHRSIEQYWQIVTA